VALLTPPPYRLGVSEFTTTPWSFEEDVERYAELGVQAIELCEIKLDVGRIAEQLQLADERGLQISSVQPLVRTLFPSRSQPDPVDVGERMQRYRQTIELFGDRAAGLPFITNTGIPPDGNVQEVYDRAAREYPSLADYAAERGARVALEPLNASIANVETAIWTLQQGLEIVERVDRPNFGICLDSWNIWQNANLLEAIAAAGTRIFVVQLSDWRIPRSFQDRLVPGQGDIPLPSLLRGIHDAGYRGPYVVEIFSHGVPGALWDGDLNRVVADSITGVDAAWRAAFES
jgi:sugar phosphate isomerase/epimerase